MSKTFRIGDIVTAKVTGVQNYGVFLELDEDTQGLIHISECKHGYMDNVHDFVKVGQEVTAKVIDVDEFPIRLVYRFEHWKNSMCQTFRNALRKIASAMFLSLVFQA